MRIIGFERDYIDAGIGDVDCGGEGWICGMYASAVLPLLITLVEIWPLFFLVTTTP